MPNKLVGIEDYTFKPEHKLFLDANIWLFVYGPNRPQNPKSKIYSQAFKNMMQAGSRIYIDVLVVSEFINRYARMKSNIVNKKKKRFKKFRQSKEFKPIAEEIADVTKQLLKHCKCIESRLETFNINSLIDEYAKGQFDFNDQVITEICKRECLRLVTDDGDFQQHTGIFVLTANQKMLS